MKTTSKIINQFKKWLPTANVLYTDNTVKFYSLIINSFFNFLDSKHITTLSEVDKELLSSFIRFKPNKKPYASASINQRIAALDLFFNWALEQRYCRHNPVIAIKKAKITPKPLSKKLTTHAITPNCLNNKEQDRLLKMLAQVQGFSGIRDACIISLILASGLYADEIIQLEIRHFHLNKGYLNIVGRGKKERRVNFDLTICKQFCENWLKIRKQCAKEFPLLFFTQNSKALTKSLLYQQISSYLNKANIVKLQKGADILRQTAVINNVNDGVDLKLIQEKQGYKHINSLERYIQFN